MYRPSPPYQNVPINHHIWSLPAHWSGSLLSSHYSKQDGGGARMRVVNSSSYVRHEKSLFPCLRTVRDSHVFCLRTFFPLLFMWVSQLFKALLCLPREIEKRSSTCINRSEPFKTYQHLPKPTNTYQNQETATETEQNLSQSTKIYANPIKPTKSSQDPQN